MSDKSVVAIKIKVRSAYKKSDERNKELYKYLENRDYSMYNGNKEWYALRFIGEGEEVKQELRRQGFQDQDFKISVEYQRKWGFL